MTEVRGEKRTRRKGNPKKIALRLVFVVVLAYVVTTLIHQQVVINANAAAAAAVKTQIAAAQKSTANLNNQISQMNSDSYIEYIARTKLGLVKPDEKVFVDAGKAQAPSF